MTDTPKPEGSPAQPTPRRGYTRISARALQAVAAAVVSDQLHVPASRIQVELKDVDAKLALAVRTPVTWQHVMDISEDGPNLFQVLDGVRQDIAAQAGALMDRKISVVDFRVTGISNVRKSQAPDTGRVK